MGTIERTKRIMDVFADKEKKLHVLTKFLMNQEVYEKDVPSQTAFLKKVSPDATKLLIHKKSPGEWVVGQSLVLYKVLGRYLQIEGTIDQQKSEIEYILNLDKISIAKKERERERVVVPVGSIWITSLKISKARIETDLKGSIPTAVKVSLENYQHKLQDKFHKADLIRVSVFGLGESDLIRSVRKTMKILYVRDVSLDQDFKNPISEDFLDLVNDTDLEVEEIQKDLKRNKIVSLTIIPIIYLDDETQDTVALGYISVYAKANKIELEKVMELKVATMDIVELMRQGNMVTINDKFPVLDISEGGLKVRLKHEELTSKLQKINGFHFDLFFKMQAPITLYGIIKNLRQEIDGGFVVGISIGGHSARRLEKQRYVENLNYFRKNILH